MTTSVTLRISNSVNPGIDQNPNRRRGVFGGFIKARIASNTTLNRSSYVFSSAFRRFASYRWEAIVSRIRTKARMIAMLT